MGHVDVFDSQLKKYTVAQKVGNRKEKSQWLKRTASYFLKFLFSTLIHYGDKILSKKIQIQKGYQGIFTEIFN